MPSGPLEGAGHRLVAARLLANFWGFYFRGNDMPSSNYPAVAGNDRRENQHGNVLKSLRAENAKLRERAVDIILEIEKIREAKYSLGRVST
jgi:hypothetical protein